VLALVWDGAPTGVLSIGRAPAGASIAAVRAALAADPARERPALPGTGGMPSRGALSVTVPGAVAGWQHLLDRFGTATFGTVARAALAHARDGFTVSAATGLSVEASRPHLAAEPGWADHYGRMRTGARFVQPALAATLTAVAEHGPDAVMRGPVAEELVATLRAHGSTMALEDLAAHQVEEVAPLAHRYRDVEVLELPPPTQGVTALTALGVLDLVGALPDDDTAAVHLQVEAVRAALADREQHLGDPDVMRTTSAALLSAPRLAAIAARIDPDRTAPWPPARPAPGGTAFLCVADADGLLVSLIQSNFMGFGSGVVLPRAGFGLHDRGAHLSLDPADMNALGPRRRPLHTLIPALALRDGRPHLVFGTMGGDAQAQVHVQLLGHLIDRGSDVAHAVTAPRFVVDVADGSVALEPELAAKVAEGLTARGHQVSELSIPAMAGHAHAISLGRDGYVAAADPRSEGAALGL
jgi:gamma-glutamyltranspeptidase / glutathione hydrolase